MRQVVGDSCSVALTVTLWELNLSALVFLCFKANSQKQNKNSMWFEFFAALLMMIEVLWCMTPCRLVSYKRFGGACRLHRQGSLKMKTASPWKSKILSSHSCVAEDSGLLGCDNVTGWVGPEVWKKHREI
jgi:hypothetical protein